MIRGVQLNAVLIAFNLIPIPPLDGSHVMKYLLPPAWALRYMQFGRMGVALLIARDVSRAAGTRLLAQARRRRDVRDYRSGERHILPSHGQWLR